MTPGGAPKLGKATSENIGRQLAMILDGACWQSAAAPSNPRITLGRTHQPASFTQREVEDMSLILRSGVLVASRHTHRTAGYLRATRTFDLLNHNGDWCRPRSAASPPSKGFLHVQVHPVRAAVAEAGHRSRDWWRETFTRFQGTEPDREPRIVCLLFVKRFVVEEGKATAFWPNFLESVLRSPPPLRWVRVPGVVA